MSIDSQDINQAITKNAISYWLKGNLIQNSLVTSLVCTSSKLAVGVTTAQLCVRKNNIIQSFQNITKAQ